jgi:hypothetical protein
MLGISLLIRRDSRSSLSMVKYRLGIYADNPARMPSEIVAEWAHKIVTLNLQLWTCYIYRGKIKPRTVPRRGLRINTFPIAASFRTEAVVFYLFSFLGAKSVSVTL